MSLTANAIFSLVTRTSAVLDHSMLRRFNLGFTLHQPFAWSLINSAGTLCRMLDEQGYLASEMTSPALRDEMLTNPNLRIESIDQLLIKCATLRNWNRRCSGTNDIGMGQIAACLRTGDEGDNVNIDDIKNQARSRVKAEVTAGRLRNNKEAITARYKLLVSTLFETASKRHAQMKRLMDEVFFVCNSHDAMLFVGNFEQQLEANTVYADTALTDYDQYGHLADALAEKLVMPVTNARNELQAFMDRSFLQSTQTTGAALMAELTSIAKELGIDWAKIDAEKQSVNALIDGIEAANANAATNVDNAINSLDEALTQALLDAQPVIEKHRTLVKSTERLAREAEEAKAAAQRADKRALADAEAETNADTNS